MDFSSTLEFSPLFLVHAILRKCFNSDWGNNKLSEVFQKGPFCFRLWNQLVSHVPKGWMGNSDLGWRFCEIWDVLALLCLRVSVHLPQSITPVSTVASAASAQEFVYIYLCNWIFSHLYYIYFCICIYVYICVLVLPYWSILSQSITALVSTVAAGASEIYVYGTAVTVE